MILVIWAAAYVISWFSGQPPPGAEILPLAVLAAGFLLGGEIIRKRDGNDDGA